MLPAVMKGLMLMLAAAVADGACPTFTSPFFNKIDSLTGINGHFISASMSWKRISERTAQFEIWSTWRRKYGWPCPTDSGFQGEDGWPVIGEKLSVVGLSRAADASKDVTIKFYTGDGASYDVEFLITSYSVEEDWVMGVTYITHTYQQPFGSFTPFYPSSYLADPAMGMMQPVHTYPWTAYFAGCCRQWYREGTSPEFYVETKVDLSNHLSSARIVSLPFLSNADENPRPISMCALPVGGKMAQVELTGSTLYWPSDDNRPATFTWTVTGTLDFSVVGPADKNCVVIHVPASSAANGTANYLTVECKMGTSTVQGTYPLLMHDKSKFVPSNRNLFGCSESAACGLNVTLGKFLLPYKFYWHEVGDSNKLEGRYIVASGMTSGALVATGQEGMNFTTSLSMVDNADLPAGSRLISASLAGMFVTGLDVQYLTNEANSDPLAKLPISSVQRDYFSSTALPAGWQVVPDSNFNGANGGAIVQLLVQREKPMGDGSQDLDYSKFAAITDIQLATASQVAYWTSIGYSKLDKNLLDQSQSGEIYIMYKRGSGPPVVDVSATPSSGYVNVTASSQGPGGKVGRVNLYVKFYNESILQRYLLWKPCDRVESSTVLCFSSFYSKASNAYHIEQGPQQCVKLDVVRSKPPVVSTMAAEPYHAMMGKLAEIEFHVQRQDLPLTLTEDFPSMELAAYLTRPGETLEQAKANSTGVLPGLRWVGGDKTTSQLSRINQVEGGFHGFLQWTPSPAQGGWQGFVCLTACIAPSPCSPADAPASDFCSEHCVQVVVDKCIWYLNEEDSFEEIAKKFRTDWLLLWHLNPMTANSAFPAMQRLHDAVTATTNIGRLYKPRWDDTFDKVATRFGISVQRLLEHNVELVGLDPSLLVREDLGISFCVIPDACSFLP